MYRKVIFANLEPQLKWAKYKNKTLLFARKHMKYPDCTKTYGIQYLGWDGVVVVAQFLKDVLLGIILKHQICTKAHVSSLHPYWGGVECQSIFDRHFMKYPHLDRSHV